MEMTTVVLLPIVLIGLLTIGLIFARLYRRASKERAFVRTGLGGQKVVKDGGALVLPIFHELIPVNMNTLKLEVMRNKVESLITKDRMRVDIVAAFFVRVIPKTVDQLILFADNKDGKVDPLALEAAEAYDHRGIAVVIEAPEFHFGDWNDVLRAERGIAA